MCKFTNRLFGLLLLQFIAVVMTKPVKTRSNINDLIELLYNDYGDYGYQAEEIHYDQRQKGEENLQLKMDGFLIGLPASYDVSWLDVLTDEYLSNAFSKKQSTPEAAPNYQARSENNVTDIVAESVINIPAPKKDVESRQQANEQSNSSRSRSHILQFLQMLRRPQA